MADLQENPSGIVLFSKQSGLTSFSSLWTIKNALKTKKVGHTGTLDSFADGLLVVMVGKMTKLVSHVTAFDKEYEAIIVFGKETDTLDPTGTVVLEKELPNYKDLEEALRGNAVALWTRVVKTSILKQVLFKEGTLFEDLGHHYRLLEKCNTFSCLGKITHIWNRTSTNNISSRNEWVWYRFNFCGEMYELIRTTTKPERKAFYLDVLKQYMLSLNDMVDSL